MRRVRVGLLGLGDVGMAYLAALRRDEQFDLVAVADPDPARLRRGAEPLGLLAYGDFRSLIVECSRSGLDLLVVALEPFESCELLPLAAQHGVAAFCKAPLARGAREGRMLVERFETAGRPLVVARWWQHDPAMRNHVLNGTITADAFAVSIVLATADRPAGWRADRGRAGGGVLLNGAYGHVDLLVHLLGTPESVYAQTHRLDFLPGASVYDTEDVAHVVLRFEGGRGAVLSAWRGRTSDTWTATIASPDRTTRLFESHIEIIRTDGSAVERHTLCAEAALAADLTAIGSALLSGVKRIASTGREHVMPLAVIEAAYLSAKTGVPESPQRFLV